MPATMIELTVTLKNRHFTPVFSTFGKDTANATSITVAVARNRSKLSGHVEGRSAVVILDQKSYDQLWRTLWSSTKAQLSVTFDKNKVTGFEVQPQRKSST